jgi:hypothetical protein
MSSACVSTAVTTRPANTRTPMRLSCTPSTGRHSAGWPPTRNTPVCRPSR